MIQINNIGQITELQIVNGDIFTESYPTNFHSFYKRKMLTASESPNDFKEVTEAEKTALEEADAAWERPPQWLIDRWKEACKLNNIDGYFGTYNENTGFFELNGIKDIGTKEAIKIDRFSKPIEAFGNNLRYYFGTNNYPKYSNRFFCRTYYPFVIKSGPTVDLQHSLFMNNNVVEVVSFVSFYGNSLNNYPAFNETFRDCTKLRIIKTTTTNLATVSNYCFFHCESLEELYVASGNSSSFSTINLSWSPKIKLECFKYMITNSVKPFTVIVHPAVYAKINGDATNEAFNELTDEEKEEWQSLLTAAAEKNISFATT